MNALLHVQCENRDAVPEFLDYCGNDNRPQAHWISRNYEKRDLPRQSDSHKAVVKTSMSDRWRIIASNEVKDEEQRRRLLPCGGFQRQKGFDLLDEEGQDFVTLGSRSFQRLSWETLGVGQFVEDFSRFHRNPECLRGTYIPAG